MTRTSRLGRLAAVATLGALLILTVATGAPAGASGWQRIEHPALAGGVRISFINDVLPPDAGGGWLAGGWVTEQDGTRTPSIWASPDGKRWQRTTLPATPSSEPRDGIYDIARRGEVVVALGERFENVLRNAAWRRDKRGWTAIEDESDAILGFAGRVVDVTASPTRFLAVGVAGSSIASVVTLFASPDGRSWHADSTIPLRPGERFVPSSVIAVGTRVFVAGESFVGTTGNDQSEGRIWSWDGSVWTQANAKRSGMANGGRTQIAAIAYRPGVGFVAGGLARPATVEQPAAWFSRDGIDWSRLPQGAVPFPTTGAAIHEIVSRRGGFLAAGNSSSGPVLWRTTDGRRWVTIDTPKKPVTADWENVTLASTDSVTVLVASSDHGSDAYRRAPDDHWSTIDRPPAFPGASGGAAALQDVAASSGRVVAIGQDARGLPLVLASKNARSWTRMPLNDRHARLLAIAENHGVFAIAGWRLIRGQAHVALWTSSTGRTWHLIGGTRFDPIGALTAIMPDGRRFVAGSIEGSPRGLQVGIWAASSRALLPGPVLGPGEPRGICGGPTGAMAIAIRGVGRDEQIVAWHRDRSGAWSHSPEIVANAADATGCTSSPGATLVVGSGATDGSAVAWKRASKGGRWDATVLANTSPRSAVLGAAPFGRDSLITGEVGTRGQVDLAVWASDGVNWTTVGAGDPVFAELGYQEGRAITTFAGRIVVVGITGSGNGAIWVGQTPTAAQRPDSLGG